MTKITYLLGAGASAHSLPTVAGFPKAIEYVGSLVKKHEKLPWEVQQMFLDKLSWLHVESQNHASVDTFARKLYLTRQIQKLNELKALLDCFFVIYQLIKNLDPRYDAFFAAILAGGGDTDIRLPENLNIISWNYDFQLELAAYNFYKTNDLNHLEKTLSMFPNSRNTFNANLKGFNIVKLNGTSGGLISSTHFIRKQFLHLLKNEHESKISESIKNYYDTISDENYNSSILFAWEKNEISNRSRQIALDIAHETEILVVIGYSFPTFNREIDKEVLNSMQSLRKIIIQSPSETIDGVALRLKSLMSYSFDNIERNIDKNEFFIPFEF